MRILVLEDNPYRVKKFRRELIGNIVDCAVDVRIATSFLVAHKYDLMFLDHDLGQQEMVDSSEEDTGYQFALAIAADERNRNVAVVVHSCNPAGADNIVAVLPSAAKVPFTALNIADAVKWAAAAVGDIG